MIDDLLRESGVATLWREEAKREGREEGKQEGLREGRRELVRLRLEGRFGPLSTDVVSALHSADDTTLVTLVTNMGTDTLALVWERLGLG